MARQNVPVEINTFVGGLVTESSALNFPQNASILDVNFQLNNDGSRYRRLGVDEEDNSDPFQDLGNSYQTWLWENAGGIVGFEILVAQVGDTLYFFKNELPLSQNPIFNTNLPGMNDVIPSVTFIDGYLVLAYGQKDVIVFSFNGTTVVKDFTGSIRVRDTFGLQDDGLDQGNEVLTRPTVLADAHLYNLRNQGWAVPRKVFTDEAREDLVNNFFDYSSTYYPSNSDTPAPYTYPDSGDTDDRLSPRFFARDANENPIGSTLAARGHFIIDLFNRSLSREQELTALYARYPDVTFLQPAGSLPNDSTTGGINVVASYAGRVWYSGFDGELVDGDRNSPRLESVVTYSQVVNSLPDISKCYQEGDYTSVESPDLLATDGGFIRISGAVNINNMFKLGNYLMILAENGLWAVAGGDRNGFTADNFVVIKISDFGSKYPASVTTIDNSVAYWGDAGIYVISLNDLGEPSVQDITGAKIRKYYDGIPANERLGARGVYYRNKNEIRWTHTDNSTNPSTGTTELVLNLTLGAFSTNFYEGGLEGPRLQVPLVAEGELIYLASLAANQASFAQHNNALFKDWDIYDAEATLITGYAPGGDFQRYKKLPYITFYFERTETSFVEDEEDFTLSNPSSCKVRVAFEWTDDPVSGRWSKKFQAYRLNTHFMAEVEGTFGNGYPIVATKNKVRGKGRVYSILITSEPEKDMKLLGWSTVVGINGNV